MPVASQSIVSDPHADFAGLRQPSEPPQQYVREAGGFRTAARPGKRPVAVSLFDESGNMLRPWAEAGWECWNFDILAVERTEIIGRGLMHWKRADLKDPLARGFIVSRRPSFLSSFGPCDDLAGCGARHFAVKRARNPDFQRDALDLWMIGPQLGEAIGCAWMAENPRGIISTMWRRPDHKFNPCDYGGYLPGDDTHPRWPDFIEPRDAYTKETWIWSGGGFVMPPRKPVEPIMHECKGSYSFKGWKKLGGKSAKTKQIRSETPRGFALAAFEANARAILSSPEESAA